MSAAASWIIFWTSLTSEFYAGAYGVAIATYTTCRALNALAPVVDRPAAICAGLTAKTIPAAKRFAEIRLGFHADNRGTRKAGIHGGSAHPII
jgi:hypothetical protein